MKPRHLLSVLALLALPLLAACSGGGLALPDATPTNTASSAEPVETVEDVEDTPDAPEYTVPEATDFVITLKKTRQQCFGSAGCNVTVEPELSYIGIGTLDPSITYQITYQIKGDEDGPVIDTMDLANSTEITYRPSSISTRSSGTKVTAEVTAVDETV